MTQVLTITIRDRIYNKIFYPGWRKKFPSKSERVEELIDIGLRSKEKDDAKNGKE